MDPSDVQHQTRGSGDGFRRDIEGLRGVAVLLVVACHCGICAGGFIGVDVFFVISGYLITGLLAKEYREGSRIDLLRFFARRARRLLPACSLVLVATALAAAVTLAPQDIDSTARAAAAASFYVSNIFFEHAASDYFAPAVERNPLLHTWSLGLEEQFYLVWPWVTLLAIRLRPQRSMWVFGLLTLSSFACFTYATRFAPIFAFYALPARAWEFAAGGLLALAPAAKASARIARWAVHGGVLGIAAILGAAAWVRGGAGFPGWTALLPVGGTLAVLFAGASAPRRGLSAALGTAPLQFVGARSYSWYLWHWPFIVFAGVLFPDITVAQKIEAAIASFLIAACAYHWMERPVRGNSYLGDRSRLSLCGAAGAALLTLAAAGSLASFGRQQMTLDREFQSIEAATIDYGFASRQCYVDGASDEVRICAFGDPNASHTFVLFGDSHAMQWINAMRTIAVSEGWRLLTMVRPGCAASDINPHRLTAASDLCVRWRARAIEQIIVIAPSAVVMASYNGAILRADPVSSPLMPADEIRSGTRRTLVELVAAGIAVVVLRDSPLPPFDIPACMGRALNDGPHASDPCEFDAAVGLNPAAFIAERAAADGLANVSYLDMDDLICPGASCPAAQRGQIIYRDENHLTGTYAESLAPAVRRRLLPLLIESESRASPGSSRPAT